MTIDLRRKVTVPPAEIERIGRAAMEDPGDDLVPTLCQRCWRTEWVAVNRLETTCPGCKEKGGEVNTFVVIGPDGKPAPRPDPVDPSSLPDLGEAPGADLEKLVFEVHCDGDMRILWRGQLILSEPIHQVLARSIQQLVRTLRTRYGRGVTLRFARRAAGFDGALRSVAAYWDTRAANPWCRLHWGMGSRGFTEFLSLIEKPVTFGDFLMNLTREYRRPGGISKRDRTAIWNLLAASATAIYAEFDSFTKLAGAVAAEARALNPKWTFDDSDVAAHSSSHALPAAVELFRDKQGDLRHNMAIGIYFLGNLLEE